LISARKRPFRRNSQGNYVVNLDASDRELLGVLPEQLKQAVAANPADNAFRRLFPPAYANDEAAETEYRRLVGTELDESRSQALETLARTAGSAELTPEEMDGWLRALNDIRLWLGTVLDVSEDMGADEPEDPPHILYHVLTYLQGSVIDALTDGR
jgi:hypothetical protein